LHFVFGDSGYAVQKLKSQKKIKFIPSASALSLKKKKKKKKKEREPIDVPHAERIQNSR
jgi:hypothetical protein